MPDNVLHHGHARTYVGSDGNTYSVGTANPSDSTPIYNDGYDSRCGMCWLGYAHTEARHARDTDCTVDPKTDTCVRCGVYHGDPCPHCGGRGFHAS